MAENVVFDNQQVDPNDPNAQVPQEGVGVQDIVPLQEQGAEGVPPEGGEPPYDDGGYYEAPPPSGLKSKKVIIIIIAVIIIILLIIIIFLVMPKNQRGKDVTLTWWGLWEDNTTMQPLIDNFEKQNPGIKISYIKQDPEKYRDTIITRINNGSGPDIVRYHNTWTPTLTKQRAELLAPLPKDVINPKDFAANYYTVIQNDMMQRGAIFGIPLGVDCIAMFVNMDLLNASSHAVPTDWINFRDAAKAMTVKDQDTNKIITAGAAFGAFSNIKHAPDIISVMLLQKEVDIKKIADSKDNLNDALDFYTKFSKGKDAVWDSSLDNSLLAFSKGDLGIYFGFSWDVFAIEQLKANSAKNFKYQIFTVPSLPEGKSQTIASYWVEGVSSKSKNQKEAMIFMRYLTQKDTLQRFYTESSKSRLFGEPYPRIDMADELKENALIYPFVAGMKDAGSSLFASDTRDGDTGLNKRLNSYLENYINAVIVKGSSSDTEYKAFIAGVTQVLNDNGIK